MDRPLGLSIRLEFDMQVDVLHFFLACTSEITLLVSSLAPQRGTYSPRAGYDQRYIVHDIGLVVEHIATINKVLDLEQITFRTYVRIAPASISSPRQIR